MESLTVKHVITEDRGAGNSDFYAVTLADTRKAWGKPPIAALPIENHKYAVLFAAAPELLDAVYRAIPYLEDAAGDPCYKPGSVARIVSQFRDLLKKAEGKE